MHIFIGFAETFKNNVSNAHLSKFYLENLRSIFVIFQVSI